MWNYSKLLVFVLLGASMVCAGQWPHWRGPNFNGTTDGAKGAAPGASVAHDHKSGSAGIETLVEIGALGLAANRVHTEGFYGIGCAGITSGSGQSLAQPRR